MKLKSLEVQGFKTFPDRTKLNFTEGITAVVGPNGSGKSNISDAIRWVLGEQSAKALRCSKMEDVIFNGTQQRKKTGYAQVTLSIDNSDRTLQFDKDEVAVTRRFYRSGNSEYLINNTAVRLQDIHELFMDTGLGRDGYSMIGQGKIDSIVATKGEDRREIFEEAAGISKFRYKKAEAERRLDKTEENLIRLRDIMSELEGRVEPLRVQSEKARAYLEYANEKQGLEIALWLKTLDKSSMAVREQEDKITVAQAQMNDTEQAAQKIQEENEQLFQKQNAINIRIEELRRKISNDEESSLAKKSNASVLQNDIKHNNETIIRINYDTEQAKLSEEQLSAEITEKQKSVKAKNQQLQTAKAELAEQNQKLEQLRSSESESSTVLDSINAELTKLAEKVSDARIQYMTSASSISEMNSRLELSESQIHAKNAEIQQLKQLIADYSKMSADCETKMTELSQKRSELGEKLSEKSSYCESLKKQADDLSLEAKRLSSKARTLEELEKNLEGFTLSVKMIMREAEKGTLSGIHGPVSRVLQTPRKYSIAIETALGAAMQNIVVSDDSIAKKAIAYLKSHNGGRATFLPMTTIKGRELYENGLEECRGFIGIASELCSCEDCYQNILKNLLGRIIIAENLDCAAEIAKKYAYKFKIVTLDGQVVNAGGSLTGGSLAKNTGLLGRASEMEAILSEASKTSEKAEQCLKKHTSEIKILNEINAQLEAVNQELTEIQSDKLKIDAEIKGRNTELSGIQKSLSDMTHEKETSSQKLEEYQKIMDTASQEMKLYQEKISRNEEAAKKASGNKNDFTQKREELTEKLQEIKLTILTLEKDISSENAGIANSKLRNASAKEKIIQNQEEIKQITLKNQELEQDIQTLEREANDFLQKAEESKQRIESLNSEKMGFEKRQTELRQEERKTNSEREKISIELARLEERRLNLQKKYDDIISKLWEEYELTKREAETVAAPIEDTGKAERRLAELKQKIRSLGSVNVSAIEEYQEVSERYEFLKIQIGDVEKSKAELLHLINDLTKQMREIFVEKFHLINQHFGETFTELFGGGKASLSLSDPENVLTAGIEISVAPPGKIVSHIELLSGGEKALVAIALYFAIMKVSPAPFCVMDEIEAALDDVNVYRFAEYLRRMNDHTQFICITHRRGTMEEADVLYGVTMQDRGISRLLELRAAEIEQKLGIKA